MRRYEDFFIGQVFNLERASLSAEEIKEFAGRWDPQPFHVDDDAARGSIYGGLIASGMHTLCSVMGNFTREVLVGSTCMGSPGMRELRFHAPVRPGDGIKSQAEVIALRRSESRPELGIVEFLWTSHNGDTTVMTASFTLLFT
ncbi:MaoC/PaaZ C-terminal domain-containing protein [Streptomyces echinatus]|uniref:MaoC/PaaZ C-terminal domain-containing protein n=1 Tax=Streptomyces echinatus TaxID=67293 RepID=UPI0037A5B3CD